MNSDLRSTFSRRSAIPRTGRYSTACKSTDEGVHGLTENARDVRKSRLLLPSEKTVSRSKTTWAALITILGASTSVFGQGPSGVALPPAKVFTIRPAAAPVPALKYRLLPERRDLIAGNAAIFYHRAIEGLLQRRLIDRAGKVNAEVKIYEWTIAPLQSIPREELRTYLTNFHNVLHEVELGARREYCNWEFDRRDEGFALGLDDIQSARSLSRLIVLKARLEILDGHPEQAVHWLRTGVVLARHVANGNSIIQALVGSAIASTMTGVLEELVQAPGSPNLYWALAGLPKPCVDFASGFEGERYMLEREIPALRELDSDPWSLERAQTFANDLQRELGMLTGMWAQASGNGKASGVGDWGKRLLMTSLVARAYPMARQYLIAEGRPASQVEAMPVIQAVTLYSMKMYEQMRDDIFKWVTLPFPQSHEGMEASLKNVNGCLRNSKQGLPFGILLPALGSALVTSVRLDRRLSAIQGIEAIRLYTESHGGNLPPSLEAITEAPVPLDPATGKPFAYKVDGATAMLSAPVIPGEASIEFNVIRYELKLTK